MILKKTMVKKICAGVLLVCAFSPALTTFIANMFLGP